ncbi:MAG: winged helix-turn-helix transcriptional regulator [Desulfovibrionaceae bacterium]|jgi:DNA-binding MarR family transcriptional regulator
MLVYNGAFLKPSKEARVLSVLDALSRESGLSQFELGRRLKLSGAMVNQYLNRLQEQELVRFLPVNGKSFRYELTSSGESTLRAMFQDYSSETIRLYTAVKGYVHDRLAPLSEAGKTRIVLFGASETCEVVLSAIQGSDFQILALCDNDQAKQGTLFHGYVVCSPVMLEQMEADAVVITSFGRQDEIYSEIKPLSERKGFSVVRF